MIDSKTTVNTFKQPHKIVMEDRSVLTITGVSDVDSFDEDTIVLFTDFGEISIRGSGLHINKLSLETGDVIVDGKISAIIYQEQQKKSSGIMGKLFR